MAEEPVDVTRDLMLDGNAVAGLFYDVFGLEMTAAPAECANCGKVSAVGELLAFTQAPGVVLRCPACEAVVVRMVATPSAIYLDLRGAAYIRLDPATAFSSGR
jgi:hypothetical protein